MKKLYINFFEKLLNVAIMQ